MTTRTRLALSATVLLVGTAVSACGAAGAPTDASKDDFCKAQTSILEDLDLTGEGGTPSEKDMADSFHTWADRIEEVGTPKGISDEQRDGFELQVKQAKDVDADDLDFEGEGPSGLEDELTKDEEKQAQAFSTYVTETCGDMLDEQLRVPEMSEIPEMPEMPESTE